MNGQVYVDETVKRWTAVPSPAEIQDYKSTRTPEGYVAILNERTRWRTDPEFRRRRIAPMRAEAKVVAMITGALTCAFLWFAGSVMAWAWNRFHTKRLRG
jgi:hypothetical protein